MKHLLVLLKALLIIFASIFLVSPLVVLAEQPSHEQLYVIETEVGIQSPWNKTVPITLKIKPQKNASRTEIQISAPYGIKVYWKNPGIFHTQAGQVYTFHIKVKPVVQGIYTLNFNVINWDYGSNYISSKSEKITFDDKLEVTPHKLGYTNAVMTKNVLLLIMLTVIVILIAVSVKIGIQKFKLWLKPPKYLQ